MTEKILHEFSALSRRVVEMGKYRYDRALELVQTAFTEPAPDKGLLWGTAKIA